MVVEKYDRPHTLFYLDPPYWQTEGYGVAFGFEHYQRMAELARTVEGAMLISLNEHADSRGDGRQECQEDEQDTHGRSVHDHGRGGFGGRKRKAQKVAENATCPT
jgi:site-specific DNA-adenine methylase